MKRILALALCVVTLSTSALAASRQEVVMTPERWFDAPLSIMGIAIRRGMGMDWSEALGTSRLPGADSEPIVVQSMDELQEQLIRYIAAAKQPPAFDVSALPKQSDLTMDVRNTYYAILSEYPQYKYAYDLTPELTKDGLLRCAISYMPYRTGAYPAGFQGETVTDLAQLVEVAENHLNDEKVSIRITNPTLAVDEMNVALQQVGGSYFLCQLNRDGTAIEISPLDGMDRKAALQRLEDIDAMAKQICQTCITDNMSTLERARALHAYLAETVDYDFRYYSDPASMPYDSITAYGALKNHLAICGGYAQALQALFRQAGIPCITVSGQLGRENHMWNLAKIDGEFFYFDATNDRHRGEFGYLYNGVTGEKLTQYTWDEEWSMELASKLLKD